MTLPLMLTVPEAAILLRRSESTINHQIAADRFDHPATPPQTRPRRVQTRSILAEIGCTASEAAQFLAEEAAA